MPSWLDDVHIVPDVQTEVTVRAFSFTFKRMLRLGADADADPVAAVCAPFTSADTADTADMDRRIVWPFFCTTNTKSKSG